VLFNKNNLRRLGFLGLCFIVFASCSSAPSALVTFEVSEQAVAKTPNSSIVEVPSKKITSTSIDAPNQEPLEKTIEYLVRCWSDSSETGSYEIIWPKFRAPEMIKFQEILDREAFAAFDQYSSWEGEGNSLSFETKINFANEDLLSVTSKTAYMASGAAHPQDVQTSILWDIEKATIIEPFNPDPKSEAKIFIDEENFLAFYSAMSTIAAEEFMFESWDKFNRHSPMRAVIVTPEGLTASWDRAGAVPSFESFMTWNEISGVAEVVLNSLEDHSVASSRPNCVPAWSDEVG
jgi:hypothetical protein